MAEELEPEEVGGEGAATSTKVSGMYKDWFLDYASYVILERAVPALEDGLKPVQRRLLHSMREMEDGRYHKVANLIGHTMKYHPHGDASIADALVQLGQKDLLIDCQGNWGNIYTGDRAAAPRYIEARLSKFALDVVFSPKVTTWQASYDGRGKEPVFLPVKFPLLLAQGVEGIAVGLSTKIMPHNFIELIDASVDVLRGKKPKLLPDFPTGGIADFSQYDDGKRGSRIKVRARISVEDKNLLKISEIPFGTTTTSLIDSVLKANDRGKIKIKRIEDNTAEHVEILIHIPSNLSPDKTIDALYAFTDCEVSISPLCCVIENDRPFFAGVSDLIRLSTEHTLDILKRELEVELDELEEQWHFANLERIFIENRIYRDIEEEETWEGVIKAIDKGLKPHTKHLKRAVTEEDIVRLTEIRIKRISKFDLDKAQQQIEALEGKIEQVKHNLDNLVDFAIDYFKNIKAKYKEGKERKTEIRVFADIVATKVAIANERLYVNREEGFIGTSLRRDEFVTECSDIDDIIVFRKDGKMMVTRVDKKTFVGKDILHVAVWKKKDARTVYNMIYRDGPKGAYYVKRFSVTSITRDREYDLTAGTKGSYIEYFTANPNGEAEMVMVYLRQLKRLKKTNFELNFADLLIKGRGVKGNLVSKNPIKRIELREEGVSTLKPQKIWFDDTVRKLNTEGRGELLGEFSGDDRILEVSQNGTYRLLGFELTTHFEDDMVLLEKHYPEKPLSVVYFEGEKSLYYVKRFIPELVDKTKKVEFLPETEGTLLELVTTDYIPQIEIEYTKLPNKERKPNETVNLSEFISVKGLKALGNQLTKLKVRSISLLEPIEKDPPKPEVVEEEAPESSAREGQNLTSKEDVTSTNNEDMSADDDGQITLEWD
ncbi:DNA gyrase/topoisomerase IV subunit A [Cryomorphaceae bacterium]|nr:DNA gyrase/topoisomerase IV subunit A [Cryomorphaceae bacterium]